MVDWRAPLRSKATTSMRSARLAKALPIMLCFAMATGCGFRERSDLLILVRAGDSTSLAIGRAYASARNVPSDRILELRISDAGESNQIDVSTFETEIAAPIESYLAREDPEGEVSILVTTLGLPLRIGHCTKTPPPALRNCRLAAVDAALAGLGRVPVARGLSEATANPYFGDVRRFERFRRDRPEAKLRFLVARITGPPKPIDPGSGLPSSISPLIDRPETIDAGTSPLWRIVADAPRSSRAAAAAALFDPIGERLRPHGHRVCDACPATVEASPAAGIVIQGNADPVSAGAGSSALASPGLLIALGGTTDFLALASKGDADKDASDPFHRFLAKWFARGARTVSAHLEDPSLAGVTRPAIQLQAWTRGRTAIEAHFASVPHLGWVNVFVGDPLAVIDRPIRFDGDDRDADGIPDERDNCLDLANPEQRDSNEDQIGNRCDPDVNDDGRVDTSWGKIYPLDARGDLEAIALTARNGPHDPDHDLNGDGRVDESDLALAQLWLFRSPGPSGYPDEKRPENAGD